MQSIVFGKRLREEDDVLPPAKKARVLDEQLLSSKISSLGSLQIISISNKIAECIMENLGFAARKQVQDLLQPFDIHVKLQELTIFEPINYPFLSEEKSHVLFTYITEELCTKITYVFSLADSFIEQGWSLQISDYDPTEFLAKIAKKAGIQITLADIPWKYFIHLKIDKKRWLEEEQLCFELTETSKNVEFCQTVITLSDKFL
jgi:hypothetical protein